MDQQPADVAWRDLESGSLPEIPDPYRVEPQGPDSLFGPIDPGEQVGRDSNAERHTRGETGQRGLAGHGQAEMSSESSGCSWARWPTRARECC